MINDTTTSTAIRSEITSKITSKTTSETIQNLQTHSLLISNIQRFSVHDGPGIRTVIFFPGCNLQCKWCHNPELQNQNNQLEFNSDKCSPFCLHSCVNICPTGALKSERPVTLDRNKCTLCNSCVENCSYQALRTVSREITVENLLTEILKDKSYFDASGGGVTLSGGEPLLQSQAIQQLLQHLKQLKIHTLIETAGAVNWDAFDIILPWVDTFFFDIKAAGDKIHQKLVGVKPQIIHQNIHKLLERKVDVAFRMLVVPGYNDQNLEDVVDLLCNKFKIFSITLLKYQSLWESKLKNVESNQQALNISNDEATNAIEVASTFFIKNGVKVIRYDNLEKHKRKDFSERVKYLKEEIRNAPFSVCLERSNLITDYMKSKDAKIDANKNSKKSVEIIRAEGLAYIMKNRLCKIYPHELLVGNFTKKRVGGHLYMEHHGFAFASELFYIDKRKTNPLQLSWREKLLYYTKLLPFWFLGNSILKSNSLWQFISFLYGQFVGKSYVTPLVASVAHFVPNFKKILTLGTDGIIEEAKRYQEKKDFYQGIQIVCEGLAQMAHNYSVEAKKEAKKLAEQLVANDQNCKNDKNNKRYQELMLISQTCANVPKRPAQTFREAIQSAYFTMIALTLEVQEQGLSFGRIDQWLYPYYKRDLENKIITAEEAFELICCFTIKMSELSPALPEIGTRLYGGMMSGQGADFGGINAETAEDATNDLTYMFLDAAGLGMRQPNYHARISASKSSPEYLYRISQLLCSGSPTPALFNDDVIIPLIQKTHHTSIELARDYAIVGCMELVLSGNHFGDTDWGLINIVRPLEQIIHGKYGMSMNISMDEIVNQYALLLAKQVDEIIKEVQRLEIGLRKYPTLLSDALIDGCMEKGIDVNKGGAFYNSSGVQAVGVADVADSLAAIDYLIFQKKLYTWEQLILALKNNFKGKKIYDHIRAECVRSPKFGNDHQLPDYYASVVMKIFSQILDKYKNTRGGPYLAGYYSMTTHTVFGKRTLALPSGRLAGEMFANGFSPTLGSEMDGPTAALNSVAKQNPGANGTSTNIKFDMNLLRGENGINILSGIINGFFISNGLQLQINTLDSATLMDALDNPEKYRDLMVRVSGYCAYFNDLTPEMKKIIINRTFHQQIVY
ncbi:MAG: glycyl-radical enzyme activating protein [Oligoflexia bacterium]|nr:glycyl-radical enzyme activating protein [Oligoflexia bacterium]